MHAIKISAVASLLLTFGCASANYQGTAHGYNAFENGKQQRYDVVFIDADHITSDSQAAVDIVPAGTHWANDPELSNINKGTPPWRRLQPDVHIGPVLFDAVFQMTKQDPPDHVRWILSFNPLIVGIDSQPEGEQLGINFPGAVGGDEKLYIGYNQHLVSDEDMNRTIQKLYFQNPWDAAPAHALVTLLPTNPTIADLFQRRLVIDAVPAPAR